MKKPAKQVVKLPLVIVQWYDAEMGGGTWKSVKSAAKHRSPVVYSVGFLLRCDKKNVVIASSIAPRSKRITKKGDVMGDLVIPRGMVKSIVGAGKGRIWHV